MEGGYLKALEVEQVGRKIHLNFNGFLECRYSLQANLMSSAGQYTLGKHIHYSDMNT